ncbi:MAG TPA: hypothetical protein VFZ41_09195 [Solirubrobacterales bacterium]
MGRTAPTFIALALVAVAATAISACGESDADLLPGETAREITANLDSVQQLADEGDCSGAEAAAQQVSEQVEALGGVDRSLKEALRDGTARLNEVVAECEEESEAVEPAELPPSEDEGRKKEKPDKEKQKEEGKGTRPEPELPPQAKGEGKGLDDGNGPSGGDDGEEGEGEGEPEAPSSGGVSPGAPVGGEE